MPRPAPPAAQQTQPQPSPTPAADSDEDDVVRITSNLVQFDAVVTDKKGKQYLVWDVDGWAVFAEDTAAFWAALPDCRERQLRSLDVEGGS